MNYEVPPVPSAPRTSGTAITSLILGCASFVCWIFTGLPAVVLGIVALRQINRSRGQLTGEGLAIGGIVTGGITTFLVLPIMVALLLPAIQAAREAARRNAAMNNMKQLMIGLQNHVDTRGAFPAAGGGEASQLSWRVHILPFLEEQALYEQFHLDEPWDSEHNRKLIAQMPDVFKDPGGNFADGETPYQLVTGPGTAFEDGTVAPRPQDFVDGTSNTIVLVEADQGVIWTKPDDWQYDPNDPLAGLGGLRRYGFLAATADAAVRFIDDSIGPEALRAMITRAGREPRVQW